MAENIENGKKLAWCFLRRAGVLGLFSQKRA
jgi:hypothetical protein